MSKKIFFAVDKKNPWDDRERENVFQEKPERDNDDNMWYPVAQSCYCPVPPGTIKSITGKTLTWADEPLEWEPSLPLQLITDAKLDKVWGNADFGPVPRIEIIIGTLKKVSQGWRAGFTAMAICKELDLIEFRNGHYFLSDRGVDVLIKWSRNNPVTS